MTPTLSKLPLVSIITPAYNAARLVSQTIESVQSQTFADWEMIIVDDSSTDHTFAVVEGYVSSDPRIRLIRHTENGGPARARNTALQQARGRYLAFIDSDDLWLPDKLKHQLVFMQENSVALSYTLYRQFTEDGDKPGRVITLPDSFTYHQLLKYTGIACLTVMVDTQITGPIAMPLVRHEDYALWLKLLKRGITAQGLMEDLARYRISKTAITGNKLKSSIWVWRIYRDIEKLSMPYAGWCFLNYGWNAYRKHKA